MSSPTIPTDGTPALDLVKVPHDENWSPESQALYTIAEAMRLTAEGSPGRVKFRPGAKLAFWSLLSQGWTPPGGEADDEAARLRATLGQIQRELDELRASCAWAHEAEEKANAARGSMASMLQRAVNSLRESARVAAVDSEPEPTLPVTQVAKSLEKVLARNRR